MSQRAEDRIGETVEVLIESVEDGEADRPGRATRRRRPTAAVSLVPATLSGLRPGEFVPAVVIDSDGRRPDRRGRPGRRTGSAR